MRPSLPSIEKGNRPQRSKALFFILSVALLVAGSGSVQGGTVLSGVRAWWVVRHLLKDTVAIQEMVRSAKEQHFNMIVVQVRGRGDSYYSPALEPQAPSIQTSDYDPLGFLIQQAHQNQLHVHVWLNVFLVADRTGLVPPDSHVVAKFPQWVMHMEDGQSLLQLSEDDFKKYQIEGIYLSPGIPEARDQFAGLVAGILEQYPVDGIHLDYIRYPDRRTDYNPLVQQRFKDQYGFSPLKAINTGQQAQWMAWRREQVTEWVATVYRTVKQIDPRVIVSAAVKADYQLAATDYGQDWATWVERDIIDLVMPMVYEADNEPFRDKVQAARRMTDPSRLCIGISVYNQPAFSAVQKLYSLQLLPGMAGVCLFSYNWVQADPRYQEKIGSGPFRQPPVALPGR